MAEVAAAAGAEDLGTDHAEGGITEFGDVLRGKGAVEAGPSGAGVELGAGGKERQAATGAEVDAILVVIEKVAAEGSLGSLGPQDAVGGGSELLFPFGVSLDDTGALDNGAWLAIGTDEADGNAVRVSGRSLCGHEGNHRKHDGRVQEMTGDHGQTIAQESEKYGTQELRKGKVPQIA